MVLSIEKSSILVDMERMFTLLNVEREVDDKPDAVTLQTQQASIRFEHVAFSYDGKREFCRVLI